MLPAWSYSGLTAPPEIDVISLALSCVRVWFASFIVDVVQLPVGVSDHDQDLATDSAGAALAAKFEAA
jgi:hypothetical protein